MPNDKESSSLVKIPHFLRSHRTVLTLKMDSRTLQLETGSKDVVDAETEKPENDDGPKGTRFALLFTCILLGSFFIGYVRADPSRERCLS
jgi:hypothetical protein